MNWATQERYNHAKPYIEQFKRQDKCAHLDLPEKDRVNAAIKFYMYRGGKTQLATDGDTVRPAVIRLVNEIYKKEN